MIAFVIEGERAPPEYQLAVVCEQFGIEALGEPPNSRTVLRMSHCLNLSEGLQLVDQHLRGDLKELPQDVVPLAHDVLRFKYRSLGETPPDYLLEEEDRNVAQVKKFINE